jgi:hypothetical protein
MRVALAPSRRRPALFDTCNLGLRVESNAAAGDSLAKLLMAARYVAQGAVRFFVSCAA